MIRPARLADEDAEPQEPDENQVDADQVIQNPRESENQDAEQQGEQRAQVRSCDPHADLREEFLILLRLHYRVFPQIISVVAKIAMALQVPAACVLAVPVLAEMHRYHEWGSGRGGLAPRARCTRFGFPDWDGR